MSPRRLKSENWSIGQTRDQLAIAAPEGSHGGDDDVERRAAPQSGSALALPQAFTRSDVPREQTTIPRFVFATPWIGYFAAEHLVATFLEQRTEDVVRQLDAGRVKLQFDTKTAICNILPC